MRFPEFNEEWKKSVISSIAEVVGGGTPDTNIQEFWEGNIIWYTPSEIGKEKYCYRSLRTISENGLKNSSAKMLPKGAILLSSRATIGEASITINECSTNQGFQSLIAKDNINNEYLYYLILTQKHNLYRKACGSTFLEISASEIRHLKVHFPSKEEQTKIATFLSLIDERIETQSKIIEDLKTLINGVRSYIFTHQNNCSKHSLGDFLTEYSERNREKQLPSVAVGKYGIRKREEIYSKELSNDYSNNKIIYKDTLTIGMGSSQIDIGILLDDVEYCVSPAYTTYKIHDINSVYLQEYLKLINPILSFKYMITSVRQGKSVNKEELMQHKIFVCSSIEQKAIEQKFSAFYKKLEIEQNLLNALVSQKKYLLQQMFI